MRVQTVRVQSPIPRPPELAGRHDAANSRNHISLQRAMVFAWNDGWRKHPLISNNMRFSVMLPGFTWGAAAFAVYLAGSKFLEVRILMRSFVAALPTPRRFDCVSLVSCR